MQNKLRFAAFAGIVYLVSFLPELTIEIIHDYQGGTSFTSFILMITYIVSMVATIAFLYGFIIIGNKFNNNLLVVGAMIIILTSIFYYIYSWYTLDMFEVEDKIFGGSVLLLYGFSGIIFGVGIYQLRLKLGGLASTAGILEIIIGLSFITIVLFLLGLVLSIPAVIAEILLLLKVAGMDEFQDEANSAANPANT